MNIRNLNLEAVQGDITQQKDIEAIVNAANQELQMQSGISGAIHTAAGKELAEECMKLAPIRTSEAVITDAYNLPNEHIIHVLGPTYGFHQPGEEFLRACYFNVLKVAERHHIASLAFPAISTGDFGYPFKEATQIALSAIKDFSSTAKSIKLIRFVLSTENDYEYYQSQLKV